jgi:UDP:flavonoid glycosyltransferase YjiC (YdhE family)
LRVVLATFGSLGDIHPVIALGRELQARGHRASILTSEFHRERIVATGLGFHPAAPDLRPDDTALIKATMDERRGPQEVVKFMTRALPQTYADYERAIAADGGADLLVTSDLAYAGPMIVEKHRLRWASQVLSPLSFLSAYDPCVLPGLPWLWRLHALGPRIYSGILGLGKYAARSLAAPIMDFRRSLGLPAVRDPFFDDKHSPDLVLAMFSRLLGEVQPDWPSQTVQTGFAFYDGQDARLAPELEAFLDAGPPPVVFTLGSAAVYDPGDFFAESARAAAMAGLRAVLLVGSSGLEQTAAATGTDIRAFAYAPFSTLFPRARVIVHQGGSGTTGQAMRAGRPMLIVPYAHDQPDNALRVSWLGISQTIRRADYRADRAAAALRRLASDVDAQTRARQVGAVVSRENGARVGADAIERVFGER